MPATHLFVSYCLLVQTPLAWRTLRVQASINVALNLVAQQRLQGVLRLVVVPVESEEEQSLWVLSRAFDASRNYPHARDQIFLELDLLRPDDEMPVTVEQLPAPSSVNSTIAYPAGGLPVLLLLATSARRRLSFRPSRINPMETPRTTSVDECDLCWHDPLA